MCDIVGKAVDDIVIYILNGLTEPRDTDADTDSGVSTPDCYDLLKAEMNPEKKLILFDEYTICIICSTQQTTGDDGL